MSETATCVLCDRPELLRRLRRTLVGLVCGRCYRRWHPVREGERCAGYDCTAAADASCERCNLPFCRDCLSGECVECGRLICGNCGGSRKLCWPCERDRMDRWRANGDGGEAS